MIFALEQNCESKKQKKLLKIYRKGYEDNSIILSKKSLRSHNRRKIRKRSKSDTTDMRKKHKIQALY